MRQDFSIKLIKQGDIIMNNNDNKSFWERFAFLYTPFMKSNDKNYTSLCDCFSKHINKNMNVLELACGTGQITFKLADKVKSWTATDFSEKMILKAGKRNKFGNINFAVADATSLPYKDNTFDAVVIANALHIMPAPDKALSEIHRVLKKNGVLFAPTFVYEEVTSSKTVSFMEKFGFKTYHKWDSNSLADYVKNKGFKIIDSSIIPAKPIDECALIAEYLDTAT